MKFQLIDKFENAKEEGGLRINGKLKKNEENKPLISIITTVKNGDKYLQEAIDSLNAQDYKNFEHIIIDGGSTDNTLSIIKRNSKKLIIG